MKVTLAKFGATEFSGFEKKKLSACPSETSEGLKVTCLARKFVTLLERIFLSTGFDLSSHPRSPTFGYWYE